MPAKGEPIGEECQVQDTSPICDLRFTERKMKAFEDPSNTQFGRVKIGSMSPQKWVTISVYGRGHGVEGEIVTNISVFSEFSF